ncbi:unnamed protein product [Moneuplotes crassus]|uniref:Uncharacterized protein n=1 Tax=Euplotes crassus TaxID=5936 RepID=A0AAD1U658_EUPCR|nr:unnamed protein product [Moneuplotes crassus]
MNSSNPKIPLKGILRAKEVNNNFKSKKVIIQEIRDINKPILGQLNCFFQDDFSPNQLSPSTAMNSRRYNSVSYHPEKKETNPGEPLFPYPPLIYCEKKNDVSKWHYIAQEANITNNMTGKGHNLKEMLKLRKEEHDKHQRLLYAFTTHKKFSDVLKMGQLEFYKKNSKSPKRGTKAGYRNTRTSRFSSMNIYESNEGFKQGDSSKKISNEFFIKVGDTSPQNAQSVKRESKKLIEICEISDKLTPNKASMSLNKFTNKFYTNKDVQKRHKLNSIIKFIKNEKEIKREQKVMDFFNLNKKQKKSNFQTRRMSQPQTRLSTTASCTTHVTKNMCPKLRLNLNSKLNRCFNIHCKEITKVDRMKKEYSQTQTIQNSPSNKRDSFERRLSQSNRSDIANYNPSAFDNSSAKNSKFREISFPKNKTQIMTDYKDEKILKETCAPGIRKLTQFYDNFQDIRNQLRSCRKLRWRKSSSIC